MSKYIFYKHKVIGPFDEITDKVVSLCKKIVDGGLVNNLPDTPFLNAQMEQYPNDVHILDKPKQQHI